MCRALKILCAASTQARLTELKRASVTAQWELVGGATSVEELVQQVAEWEPDIVVVEQALGPDAEARAREAKELLRIVVVGSEEGDASPEAIRNAILGLPRPGGPVRM